MRKLSKRLITAIIACLLIVSATGCGNKPGVAQIENNQKATLTIPDYSEYCKLGEYKGLTYSIPDEYNLTKEQKEEQIQMAINNDFADIIVETEVTDRTAAMGDTVTITYKGTINGEPFEGGESPETGTIIVLGFGGYIDGFEDGIVGMKTGETKDVTVTFPEDYDNVSLKGKDAVFTINLMKICTYELPALTDEIVKEHTTYDTYADYYNSLSTELEESIDYAVETEMTNQLLDKIIKSSTYDSFPEDEIQKLVDESVSVAKARAQESQMDEDMYVSTYYGTNTIEEYTEYMMEQAREYMKVKMVICEIAKIENIEITQEDVDAHKKYLTEYYGLSDGDSIINYVSIEDIVFECIVDKVQTILKENSKTE